MSKVKFDDYTMYTADEFCNELGWTMDDLSFDGFVPKLVFASDVEECPYCVVRCDELNKPCECENGDILEDTPHWYVFGAKTDHEIRADEVFDWLRRT